MRRIRNGNRRERGGKEGRKRYCLNKYKHFNFMLRLIFPIIVIFSTPTCADVHEESINDFQWQEMDNNNKKSINFRSTHTHKMMSEAISRLQ
jgi:hypothetical protein